MARPHSWRRARRFVLESEHAEQVFKENPHICRAVYPKHALTRLGKYWHPWTPSWSGYGDSFEVRSFDIFLSHSWHANSWVKICALHAYFNSMAAVVAGLLLAAASGAMVDRGWLPAWDWNLVGGRDLCDAFVTLLLQPSDRCVRGRGVHAWCSVGYSVGYWMAIFHGQRVKAMLTRARGTRLFFDKLVIHQTDTEKKQMGIRCIEGFLQRTRHLLVLWDPTYFTRLWCVFELAVFLCLIEGDLVSQEHDKCSTIVPISLSATELAASLVVCLVAVVFLGAGMAVGGLGLAAQLALDALTGSMGLGRGAAQYLVLLLVLSTALVGPAAFTIWLMRTTHRGRKTVLEQMRGFSVDGAQCSLDEDRAFVSEFVRGVYGSHVEFEDLARRQVLREVTRGSGVAFRTPYWVCVKALAPVSVYLGLDVPLMAGDPFLSAPMLSKLCGACIVGGLNLPVMWRAVELASKVGLDTDSRRQELLVTAAMAVASTIPIGLCHLAVPSLLSESVHAKALGFLLGVPAVMACWPQFRPGFCRLPTGPGGLGSGVAATGRGTSAEVGGQCPRDSRATTDSWAARHEDLAEAGEHGRSTSDEIGDHVPTQSQATTSSWAAGNEDVAGPGGEMLHGHSASTELGDHALRDSQSTASSLLFGHKVLAEADEGMLGGPNIRVELGVYVPAATNPAAAGKAVGRGISVELGEYVPRIVAL